MKVKVIKKFRDKNTKEIIKAGTELEITEERYAEIQSVGNFVEEVAEEAETTKAKTTKTKTAK